MPEVVPATPATSSSMSSLKMQHGTPAGQPPPAAGNGSADLSQPTGSKPHCASHAIPILSFACSDEPVESLRPANWVKLESLEPKLRPPATNRERSVIPTLAAIAVETEVPNRNRLNDCCCPVLSRKPAGNRISFGDPFLRGVVTGGRQGVVGGKRIHVQ